MIAHINGTLSTKAPARAILDVGGIGYELQIPASTYVVLPEIEGRVRLHTHLHVREDALLLYGFASTGELEFFRLLLSVSRIGPGVALNILSGIAYNEFKSAVYSEDLGVLSSIPGIGTKTAKRLILELKDKLTEIPAETGQPPDLASSAIAGMISLGYTKATAEAAVHSALRSEHAQGVDVGELIKAALKNV
ncbi:MAG: Holliday junction branch migration protein RuvA [Methanosarcinales archaeon]|nr:MAG: Holliday junction branch migration protein RuvA [Methanosarcinales archaeon]